MLTLFHDYTSPGSALAVARLQQLADEGLAVAFEGFESVGVDVAVPPGLDMLAAVDLLAGDAAEHGIVLRRPALLPPTAKAHVVAEVAGDLELAASWRRTCYQRFWRDGVDLADDGVLRALAGEAGLVVAAVDDALGDRAMVARLRRRMAQRRRDGVGGVPTILSQRTLIPGLVPTMDLRALAAL